MRNRAVVMGLSVCFFCAAPCLPHVVRCCVDAGFGLAGIFQHGEVGWGIPLRQSAIDNQ